MRPSDARPYGDSLLKYGKQLGVDDVLVDVHDRLVMESGLDYNQLVFLRNRIEDAGLRLNAIEQLSNPEYDKIILGLDGRDERMEYWKESMCALGKAGILILGFHWVPEVWTTSRTYRLRDGAKARAYDHR